MRNLFKFAGVFLLGSVLALNIGCSKSDDGPGDQLGKIGTMTMKIDGKLWEADVATVMTMSDPEVEEGEDVSYLVTMTGTKVINGDSDEVATSISLNLLLSEAAFNNPKGSFQVNSMGESDYGEGAILYHDAAAGENGKGIVYASIHPDDTNRSLGSITVKNYKIGNQSFLGQLLGKGYTELSGTFESELYSYVSDDEPLKKVVITEGKFNLNADLLSGFMK